MKRSAKRSEVINEYIKHGGGFSGSTVAKAWMWHWIDVHPRLQLNWTVIRYTEKSISAYGQTFHLADPECFHKLSLCLAANAKRRKK